MPIRESDWSWAGYHCFGLSYVTFLLWILGVDSLVSAYIAFGLGVLWEIFDQTWHSKCPEYHHALDRIFDRRGWSWFDIGCDIFGVFIVYIFIVNK